MAILVYLDPEGNVIIEVPGSCKLRLHQYQARYLLRTLAEKLGYRIQNLRPSIIWKLTTLGHVRIEIHEGTKGGVKEVVLNRKLLEAYLETLRKLGSGKYTKRELAKHLVSTAMSVDDDAKRELERYIIGGEFDWEKFFGGRNEYYTYYRAPVLLFEELGLVKSRGSYIYITDKVSSASFELLLTRGGKQ